MKLPEIATVEVAGAIIFVGLLFELFGFILTASEFFRSRWWQIVRLFPSVMMRGRGARVWLINKKLGGVRPLVYVQGVSWICVGIAMQAGGGLLDLAAKRDTHKQGDRVETPGDISKATTGPAGFAQTKPADADPTTVCELSLSTLNSITTAKLEATIDPKQLGADQRSTQRSAAPQINCRVQIGDGKVRNPSRRAQ